MSVHPASQLPWQTYRDVRLRALGTNPEAFGSSFEREVAFPDERWVERASNPGTLLWVADDEPDASSGVAPRGDGLAGLFPASGYLDDVESARTLTDDPERLAFVVQVWVEPGRRGTGVVDDLVEALVLRARELGYRVLALHVFRANERAAAAYVRHGFTQVNPPSPACPADEDEYVLTL
ncbi:GNAT family N-acetyltransferase [Dermacoccus barathri]|nr:GNAT family N-acetyltransferase [Dermacoccus barathri]MBE7372286.1 GNAT family N-acetyltransferase [Dermacoccus barathri]